MVIVQFIMVNGDNLNLFICLDINYFIKDIFFNIVIFVYYYLCLYIHLPKIFFIVCLLYFRQNNVNFFISYRVTNFLNINNLWVYSLVFHKKLLISSNRLTYNSLISQRVTFTLYPYFFNIYILTYLFFTLTYLSYLSFSFFTLVFFKSRDKSSKFYNQAKHVYISSNYQKFI